MSSDDEQLSAHTVADSAASVTDTDSAASVTDTDSASFSCGHGCCSRRGSDRMAPSSAKSLRELIFTMPGLRIYANLEFTLKSLQFESKSPNDTSNRQKALIQLICDPNHTELLRSLADMQERFGEAVYAELKLTSQGKAGTVRLDVFAGKIDLLAQVKGASVTDDDPMLPMTLRLRLVHVVGGDTDAGRASRIFGHLNMSSIGDLVRKAFEDE